MVELPEVGTVSGFSIPGSEIVTIPRHVKCRRVRAFMSFSGLTGWLAARLLPWTRSLMKGALAPLIKNIVDSGPEGAPAEDRPHQHFRIAVELSGARGGKPAKAMVVVKGKDPYGITAVISARAARAMLDEGFTAKGCLSPSMAFPARPFLTSLADRDITIERED
jgi:hypothetical protein